VANDIAEFMRGKPHIHGGGEIMKPEFGFFAPGANMHVGGLVSFVGIEESAIRAPP
jgi:hypothetical protein